MMVLRHCPAVPPLRAGTVGQLQTTEVWSMPPGLKQAMFSLRSNGLLCEAETATPALPHNEEKAMQQKPPHRTPKQGGRPKCAPEKVRRKTIGVRVNDAEWSCLQKRALHMGMSPAQWLRTAALSRRLPSPPVPEANRAEYAELSRLAVNLNQIARAANTGQITAPMGILKQLMREVALLQKSLLGISQQESATSGERL